ncbi:hypothetical protein F4859DRAFT_483147 [Xylaria cf. heliscus]|nr:hypothetical protein F4859DRAFT_483147 [Xylaria cf. heliscus]
MWWTSEALFHGMRWLVTLPCLVPTSLPTMYLSPEIHRGCVASVRFPSICTSRRLFTAWSLRPPGGIREPVRFQQRGSRF